MEDKSINEMEELEQENAPEEKESDNSSEITELESQILSLNDKILRLMAEAENTRMRHDKMLKEARDYAVTNFAKDLLSVMDNLSRTLEFKDQSASNIEHIISGVAMTKKELEYVFKTYGLDVINPSIGEKFDYNLHQAVSKIVTDEYDPDNIVELMQVGYKIKDRLIRPAMVIIAKKEE